MPSLYQLAQLGYALFLGVVIAERVRALYLRDATSDEAVRWLLRTLERGDVASARRWAEARPTAQLARMIAAALGASGRAEERGEPRTEERGEPATEDRDEPSTENRAGDLRELLSDLREETTARLRLLRVSATLASTMGLLGGILALALGSPKEAGLAALKAGGVERMAMNEALATVAIGVATSALCFQALALLKPAAQKLLTQAKQLERVLVRSP